MTNIQLTSFLLWNAENDMIAVVVFSADSVVQNLVIHCIHSVNWLGTHFVTVCKIFHSINLACAVERLSSFYISKR